MLLARSLQLFLKFTSNFWLKFFSKPIFFSVYKDSMLFDVNVFYWILSIQELLYKYVYFVQLNSAWLHYISLLKWSIFSVRLCVCECVWTGAFGELLGFWFSSSGWLRHSLQRAWLTSPRSAVCLLKYNKCQLLCIVCWQPIKMK